MGTGTFDLSIYGKSVYAGSGKERKKLVEQATSEEIKEAKNSEISFYGFIRIKF